MRPVVTPAEMGKPIATTIAAGTPEAVLVERAGTRGRPARAAAARRHLRAPGRGRVREGQQRRRRAGRGARAARLGRRRRRARARRRRRPRRLRRASSRAPTCSSTRCSAPASAARSKATPRWLADGSTRGAHGARGRHPVGRRRRSPARCAVRRCTPHATVCFAYLKPGLLFEPGRSLAGDGRGRRHRHRREGWFGHAPIGAPPFQHSVTEASDARAARVANVRRTSTSGARRCSSSVARRA